MEEESVVAPLSEQQRGEPGVSRCVCLERNFCAHMWLQNYEIARLWQVNAEKHSWICSPSLSTVLIGNFGSCELKASQTNRLPEVHPDAT